MMKMNMMMMTMMMAACLIITNLDLDDDDFYDDLIKMMMVDISTILLKHHLFRCLRTFFKNIIVDHDTGGNGDLIFLGDKDENLYPNVK